MVKSVVNSTVSQKFAAPAATRRMLQHPHYQEVSSVLVDPTSAISKEIASSPRRRALGGGGGSRAAALRAQSAGSLTRK